MIPFRFNIGLSAYHQKNSAPRLSVALGSALLFLTVYAGSPVLSQPAGGPRMELVFEVDWRSAMAKRLETAWETLRLDLQSEGIAYSGVSMGERSLTLSIDDPARLSQARQLAGELEPELAVEEAGSQITVQASETMLAAARDGAIDQSIVVLQRRMEEADVPDPLVEPDQNDRIRVLYPADSVDPVELIPLLLRPGQLEFRLVANPAAEGEQPAASTISSADGQSWLVERQSLLTGAHLAVVEPTFTEGRVALRIVFDAQGTEIFGDITEQSVGRQLAIVFDGEVLSAPTIRSAIRGGTAVVTGDFTVEEAEEMAVALRSGALPAPLSLISQQVVP